MSSATSSTDSSPENSVLAGQLKQEALRLGFSLVGIAPAVRPTTADEFLRWLEAGHAGEMQYLERRKAAYSEPAMVLDGVRSVVMLAMNYAGNRNDPPGVPGDGRIARYARIPADYHDVLRERLNQLAARLHEARPGCRTRSVVDTAPLLERDFARRAGLGWFGKNTMLLNRRLGSWFFLAALLTDVELPADQPHETAHCGTCTRCLEACPTDAFVAPYVLDARRCISYLTIELGPREISDELRTGMGDWAFGCDICQEVCPWNRKAPIATDPAFQTADASGSISLAQMLALGPEGFRERYAATPLARTGYEAILRNLCIAAGNAGRPQIVGLLQQARAAGSEVVRAAADWAIEQLRSRDPGSASGCSDPADRAPVGE